MHYKVEKLKSNIFHNINGKIIKIQKSKKKLNKIAEIYFTSVKKNKVKGWNYHLKNTVSLYLIIGKVCFYLKLKKIYKKIIISSNDNKMITIHPQTMFAFRGLEKTNIFLSMSNGVYNSKEAKKIKFIEKN